MGSSRSKVWTLAEPVAAESGLEVLEIEFSGGPSHRTVRVYLDSQEEGRLVTVDDCEAVSRTLGDLLEAHDAVSGNYNLEVSSPGLNRPLRRPEHFKKVLGGKIRVRTKTDMQGRKNFIGRLDSFEDEIIELLCDDGERFRIGLAEVDKANFEYEFETKAKPGKAKRRD